MYKLLIVDDEAIIVDGLYEMFKEWGRYPVDVFKAYSGTEALEWLMRKRIDVVITDIRMPGIDGLQLLEQIRRNWPDCKVVFLTGYNEFDYVYQAIQYEGVHYLLKTESYERIAETVGDCLEQIRQSMVDEEWVQKAKFRLEKAMPVLQREFLNELADGICPDVTQQQLNDLELPLLVSSPVLLIAGLSIAGEGQIQGGSPGRTDHYAIHYILEKHLSPYASIAFSVHRNYMLWIVQEKHGDGAAALPGNRTIPHFKGILESVQAICRETLQLNVSFVISGTSETWAGIAERFAFLRAALNSFSETGMEAVLVDDKELAVEIGSRSGFSGAVQSVRLQLKKLESLEVHLEQGRKEAFLQTFRDTRVALASKEGNAAVAAEIFYSLSLLFLSYLNRHGIWEEVSSSADYERLTRFERHGSLEEAYRYFEGLAVRIFELQNIEMEKRSVASILKVQQHIQDHPGGDLSLSSLADLVYFNPKYLSRLFKQITGANLSEYISEVKLNKVRELLVQNKLKVHEIAEYVGYFSAPCFTRFFKKATGMTPQEYRESALKSANQQVDKC